MRNDRFWRASYDDGLVDLDHREWEMTYVAAVEDVFTLFPDHVALAYMGTHITYAELDRYANRFANMLNSHGFAKGDVVGISLPNIPDYVIAWLGTLRAGCVVAGVPPLLSQEQLAFQLRDTHAKGLVTLEDCFAGKLSTMAVTFPDLELIAIAETGDFLPPVRRILGKLLKRTPTDVVRGLAGKTVYRMRDILMGRRFPSTALRAGISPDDIASIMYTAGTTGMPKGAMLSHRNITADVLIVNRWFGWESKRGLGVALSGFPLSHHMGLFFNECCLLLGWTQVLIPEPRDTGRICVELRTYRPCVMTGHPLIYQLLMDNPAFRTIDFSTLDTCISGAAPFPEMARRRLETIVGQGKIMEVYGLAEASAIITANPCRGRKRHGSVGLPVMNTDLSIRDPVTGRQVAVGEPGEIRVKGPQVMVGYCNRPEDTALVMDGDGYLRTGDMAVQDADGYVRIMDRTDDMIIVGRSKVFSAPAEGILSDHPAVGMAALIFVENTERPGSEVAKAYITLKPGYRIKDVEALKEDILAFAKDRLSPVEIPKMLEIRTELPLTGVGKVDKKRLRQESRAQIWAGRDRRSHIRGLVDLACDLDGISHGRHTHEKAHVVDLSEQGMFVKTEKPLDEGTNARISAIRFGATVVVKGTVLRSTDDGMAIRFTGDIPGAIERIIGSG